MVEGIVKDSSGRAVPDASIYLHNTSGGNGTRTDAQGRFVLQMGEPTVTRIIVSNKGNAAPCFLDDFSAATLDVSRGVNLEIELRYLRFGHARK